MKIHLLCRDLMTASRFVDERVEIVRHRDADDLFASWATEGGVILVDLGEFSSGAGALNRLGIEPKFIYGFAPHVESGTIASESVYCARIYTRGAVVKSFARVVDRMIESGEGSQ